MVTFITAMDLGTGTGPVLAVKDLIDVAGVPTTAGSRAVADSAVAAGDDAPCMAGARAAAARIAGKANLFELAYGASGINEWFGTPVNPLDARRVPGGSSSGSAVAVATGDADVAYGSDTGGSIRVPSAFCGTAGLKTTHGRVPLEGVWPLAPSLDTVGPMGRDIAGLVLGMSLLEPGFGVGDTAATIVGRLRVAGTGVDPVIDAAVDDALRRAGLEVIDVDVPEWGDAFRQTSVLLDWEAVRSNCMLTEDPMRRAKLGPAVARRLAAAAAVTDAQAGAARQFQVEWKARLAQQFARVQLLVCPTVAMFPPLLEDWDRKPYTLLTNPVNLAGVPAVALPVPAAAPLPASLQLIGPAWSEPMLLATALRVERAVAGA